MPTTDGTPTSAASGPVPAFEKWYAQFTTKVPASSVYLKPDLDAVKLFAAVKDTAYQSFVAGWNAAYEEATLVTRD